VARLYSDENFPMPVVEELRQLGHDVVSIQERGRASEGTPDEEVLKLAIAEDRAVLTIDRKDFIRLHKKNPKHSGIVVCTYDPDYPRQAARIHDIVEACSDLHGQLLRVNRPQK
jgi:predicted nuclease of predicted toxin-antitoxin system